MQNDIASINGQLSSEYVGVSIDKEPLGGDNSKSSTSAKAQVSIEDSLIRSKNEQAKITEEADKLLTKQIATAKAAKDYNSELSLSKDLIAGQTKEISQLQQANADLQAESQRIKSNSGFDTTGWLDSSGEATLLFQQKYRDANAKDQVAMKATFDELQKLDKAEIANNTTIAILIESNKALGNSLPQIEIEKFDNSISELDNKLSVSKSTLDLYNTSSHEYASEQANQIYLLQRKKIAIDDEIKSVQQQLQATNLSPESQKILNDKLDKLQIEKGQNQKSIDDEDFKRVTQTYDLQQKQNTQLQKHLDLQLQITEATNPKNYDQINVLLGAQISAQQTNISYLQSSITALTTYRDTLSESSEEWQKVNDKIISQKDLLESSISTLSQTYNKQLKNQINKNLHQAELSIFNGQTEQQAKQSLQNRQNYQNEYISGAEKQYEVESIISDAQAKHLTLSQDQLDILNSTNDIRRSDLDLIQRQLTIQENQIKLSQLQEELSLEQSTNINDQLQKELEYTLKIAEAQDPKNYSQIASIQQQMLDQQLSHVDDLSNAVNSLIQQRDTLQEGSNEWNIINEQVSTYSTNLEQAAEQAQTLLKNLLQSQTSAQLRQIQTTIFGSPLGEAQQKQALQDQVNYHNEYLSGAEKAAAVLRVQNQLQQDNVELNKGYLGSQQIILQFTQDQLNLLNSGNDIKRSDLDLLEKQLAIQKTQAELSRMQNQKSVRVLVDQGNGNYQWQWQADQSKTLQLQGQLYQEQQDLAKTQTDDGLKNAQNLLDQKSEYYKNIQTVVDNALNGQYKSITDFQIALTDANTNFLNSLQGTNSDTWNTISYNISNNLDAINDNYTKYVTSIDSLNDTIVNSGIQTKNNLVSTNTQIIQTQQNVLNTLTTIDQQESALNKAQTDAELKNDQYLLDQKSTYYNNIKTVMDNALNGQYATSAEFQNAMLNANTAFLGSLQGINTNTWNSISANVSTNVNNMITSYQNYVNQMTNLQAQLNAIAASKSTTSLSGVGTSGQIVGTSIGPNGSHLTTITTANGTQTVLSGTNGTPAYSSPGTPGTMSNPFPMPSTGGSFSIISDSSGKTYNVDSSGTVYSSYAEGGTNDIPGIAMLHGTKTSAETIFSSADSKKLWDFIHNMPNSLPSIIGSNINNRISAMEFKSQMGSSSVDNSIHIDHITVESPNVDDFVAQLNNLKFMYNPQFKR